MQIKGKNDFALVRKPSSAVEKVAPRAKRILSGMVADTFALTKKRPLKIIVVDDDEWFREFVESVILDKFQNVGVQIFYDPHKVWQELQRDNTDLLITDDMMCGSGEVKNGYDLVKRLVEKKVNYPIIIASGLGSEMWREFTDKNSNVTFLGKPFTNEQFYEELSKHLGSRLQFRNGKS